MISKIIGKSSLVLLVICAIFAMSSVPAFADINTEAKAKIDANIPIDIDIKFPEAKDLTRAQIDAKGYRGFAESGTVPIPGTPGYFGTAVPGSSFQSIKTGLIYKDVFTKDELEKMSKDNTIGGRMGSKVIVTPLVDEVADENKSESMKVLLSKPDEMLEVELLGYITVKATSKGTVSMEILAEAALAARDLGGNVIHVTAEGVDRELRAFGWGVGLSYTRASISDTENSGGVAAGGTGISGGSSKYVDLPWFQIFILKVK